MNQIGDYLSRIFLRCLNMVDKWYWHFWGFWTVVTMFGWLIGYCGMFLLLDGEFLNKLGFNLNLSIKLTIYSTICGLLIGLAQKLAIGQFRGTNGWVFCNSVGGCVGMVLWNILPIDNAVGILVYGEIVSIMQALCIKKFTWVLIMPVLWAISLILVGYFGRTFNIYIGWGAGGLAYGAITGLILALMLRKQRIQ